MCLVAIKECPVCGHSDRLPANDGIASRRKDAGRHYLEHAAAYLGVPIDQALEAIKVFYCTECRSYFCDPWISPEVAARIFTEGAPDHIAGWANFEHWLSSPNLNAVEAANSHLYKILIRRLGTVNTYAEYACPFQGFLLLFGRLELTPKQRVAAFARSINRCGDVRWTTGPRLHHAAQKLAHRMAVTYHQLRALKHGNRFSPDPVLELPKTRQLLTQCSTKAWGSNCVRYGASCSYYTSKLLGADVLPVDERLNQAAKQTGPLLDLLGIFNILDHTDHPMTVISSALKLARHVIVVTHHAAVAGKQHLFAFHESFPHWLQSTLAGTVVTDLSEEMLAAGHRDYGYILISRE